MTSKAAATLGDCASIATRREAATAGLAVHLLPRASYRAAFTPANLVVGFAFDIQCGEHAFASDRIVPFVTRPATAAVTPPGCDVYSTSRHGGEYLTMELPDPEALGLARGAMAGRPARTNLVVARAHQAASRLRALLVAGKPDPTGIEESALDLAEAVLDAADGDAGKGERGAASLTDRRLRKLNALIEDRLGDRLTLREMAASVGLRPRFFLRAFRAATGTTPHAYLMERRLEAARRSLTSTDDKLGAIAAATGFASQAHLNAVFRRAFGLTPGAFRRAVS